MIFALLFLLAQVREDHPQAPPKPPELTKKPELVQFVPAVYPLNRLARGETADVGCVVDIDATGAVSDVSVEKPAAPDFDEAAVAAIKQFRFSPAELDGKPAPVRIRYVYHFVIEQKRVEKPPEKTGTVRGQLVEAGNRKPLLGVSVVDKDSGLEAITDADGRYELKAPVGERTLLFTTPGYERRDLKIKVSEGETTEARKLALHRTDVGDSITVQGERVADAPTKRSLSHDELVNVPGSLNDPIRAVQNLPGLARAPFLGGALLVRGSPPADTGVYVDGHRIPLLYHFLGGPSVINEQMVDRIDFYPGGYGAYYGRNLVGALDVGTRPGDKTGLHGEGSLDLLEAVGYVTTPVGKDTTVSLAARRSHIDLFLPLFIPNDPARGVTTIVPIYWDYQARVDHRDFSLTLLGSDDKLTVVQKGGTKTLPLSVNSHTGFHRAIVGWRHDVSDSLTLKVSPSIGWQVLSFDSEGAGQGGFANGQSLDLTQISGELRSSAAWHPNKQLELRAGLDVDYERAKYSADLQSSLDISSIGVPITQRTTFSRVQLGLGIAEYVEGELRLGNLRIVPGLRVDEVRWKDHQRYAVDPRLWLKYTLTDEDALKAYAGLYHQPPSGQQLDADIGNPDLRLERSAQVGLGWERKLAPAFTASAEVFYNRRDDLVTRADATLVNGAVYNPRYLNQGIGRSYGLEVLIRREPTEKLYGWIAYTLSRSQIINVPGDPWRAFQFDQPHILTVLVGYKPNPNWILSSRFRLVSGNPRAPVLGSTFNADTGNFVADRGVFGDDRSPAFAQLDFRGSHRWIWDSWWLELYLDVENVTNRRNEEFQFFDYRYRDSGSIPGIPILPTFGVKGSF